MAGSKLVCGGAAWCGVVWCVVVMVMEYAALLNRPGARVSIELGIRLTCW
jgi:hypothetical protein